MMKDYKIGVLGGLGPLATVKFLEKVIDLTEAKNDQENVDMVILNHSSVPDRTDYLLNNNKPNPLPYLINDAKLLESIGCEYLVMPCNTAHSFYDEINNSINSKLINMVSETIKECNIRNIKKVGLMATRGTIATKIFDKYNDSIELIIPDENTQKLVDILIFDKVKKNINVSLDEYEKVLNYFYSLGCESVILGCTELSVINEDLKYSDKKIIDTIDVLARIVIKLSGKKLKQGEI